MNGKMFLISFLVLFAPFVAAEIPRTISYQGILTDAEGNVVPDGNYSLGFRLYDTDVQGDALWFEEHASVVVEKGLFNVILGSIEPLNLAFDSPYWLGIQVANEAELTPRIQLTAAPYSLGPPSPWLEGFRKVYTELQVAVGTANPPAIAKLYSFNEAGYGVWGRSSSSVGVRGESTSDFGVHGSSSNGVGVRAVSPVGVALDASTASGIGLIARNSVSGNSVQMASTTYAAIFEGDIEFDGGSAAFLNVGTNNNSPILIFSPNRTPRFLLKGDFASAAAADFALELGSYAVDNIMVWQANGNVGIGRDTPSERLHVSGNILATGSITPGSSRDLKENITNLSTQDALVALMRLSPVKFNYKAEKDKDLHLGFIAEDVPDLVAIPSRKGVSPMDIVAVLTKVLQEQQQMIEQLQERLDRLE